MTARCGIVTLFLLALSACSPDDRVTINGETLQGEHLVEHGVTAFRGVPFADPPIGGLRWERPQPYSGQVNTRDATKFAPACVQAPRILEWYRDLAETFGATRDVFDDLMVSEDCLYLNIWTQSADSEANLPVMVYVHGGSNSSGWAYEPNYHGHELAKRGVVLVSIAYRLGVFGFFSHPEIDDANFGLWDQVAALEWIRDNIVEFGGDPNRVLVFGESAGAQDILALMTSEHADGLFHSAVLQSTAGFGIGGDASPTLEDEQARGIEIAALFGVDGDDAIERLRAIPADELFRTFDEKSEPYYHAPAVDGQLITKPIWDVINDDELMGIPFIVGSNADEWYASTPANVTASDVPESIGQKHFINTSEARRLVAREDDPREAIDRIDSAEYMLCPSQYLAAHQTALNRNGWFYYFSRVREGAAGASVRAYHGAEIPYALGTHDPWMTTTETDLLLGEQMMAYWINLAASGDPNGEFLPAWPPFENSPGTAMGFAEEALRIDPPEPVLCRIFNEAIAESR